MRRNLNSAGTASPTHQHRKKNAGALRSEGRLSRPSRRHFCCWCSADRSQQRLRVRKMITSPCCAADHSELWCSANSAIVRRSRSPFRCTSAPGIAYTGIRVAVDRFRAAKSHDRMLLRRAALRALPRRPALRGTRYARLLTYSGDSADDTIFAVSSGSCAAAISVVRVSGPSARRVVERMLPRGDRLFERPRELAATTIVDAASRAPLDRGMAVWLPGPATATGEDVCELHIHGGRAVQSAVCRALSALPGFRPAAAGEFTRRAFAAGKLDLTAAEGLADLLRADTDAQRALALGQVGAGGRGGSPLRRLPAHPPPVAACLPRVRCIARGLPLAGLRGLARDAPPRPRARRGRHRLRGGRGRKGRGGAAAAVGALPYPVTSPPLPRRQDCNDSVYAAAESRLGPLAAEMRAHLADGRRGEVLREGVAVALFGAVNAGEAGGGCGSVTCVRAREHPCEADPVCPRPRAGKSSLLNALARRDVAIVSATPGTTRDVVEVMRAPLQLRSPPLYP